MLGLALVRRICTPSCNRELKGERSELTKYTHLHLLQSKCSSNIRAAADPLLPCVKPFTRMCRDSLGNRAAAALAELCSVHEPRHLVGVHSQDCHRHTAATPDVHVYHSCPDTTGNAASERGNHSASCSAADLKGQFEFLRNKTKRLLFVFVVAAFHFQGL